MHRQKNILSPNAQKNYFKIHIPYPHPCITNNKNLPPDVIFLHNSFMKYIQYIISIFKNKYLLSLTVFAVIILFTDHNNLFEQADRKQQLNELLDKQAYYEQKIEQTKKELAELQNNPIALEKYAREHFYMKKDNEDLFIVDPKK